MSSELPNADKHFKKEINDIFNVEQNQVSSTFSLKTDEDKMSEEELPKEQAMDKQESDDDTAASPDISVTAGFYGVPLNASTSSAASTESTVACRICKGHGGKDLVLSPCNCKGK